MNPLEYIEKGIKTGDWDMVAEGYERLTGKALISPIIVDTKKTSEDKLLKISEIISKALEDVTSVIDESPIELEEKPQKKKNNIPNKRKKKKKRKTTTVDNDEEDNSIVLDISKKTIVQKKAGETQLITNDPDPEEVEKNKIKAEKSQVNKAKLKRQTTKRYDVKCNECDQKFKSERPDGQMGQKCPSCLREKKSRFS
jgi:Zn finger protein HypA/HybF involved in hydrogenase expression